MDRESFIKSLHRGDVYDLINFRSYFDSYSDQFKGLSFEEKLRNLALMINHGLNLNEVLRVYMDVHSETTLASLKFTLLCYIQYLRWGECIHWTNEILEPASEFELAGLLQNELSLRYRKALDELVLSAWEQDVDESLLEFSDACALRKFLLGTGLTEKSINK